MKNNREFVYVSNNEFNPDRNFPDSRNRNFAGLPCPTNEVVDAIGEEGVEEIDLKLKTMIRWKEIIYGKDSNKVRFPDTIQFFDRNDSELCVTCAPLIIFPQLSGDIERMKDKYYYRDRADSRTGAYKMEIRPIMDEVQDRIFKILKGDI